MRDYVTLMAGDVTLVKDNTGVWWHNGNPVTYPWDIVHDAIEGHDYFDVYGVTADHVVDCIEYHAGYLYHVTRAVNR